MCCRFVKRLRANFTQADRTNFPRRQLGMTRRDLYFTHPSCRLQLAVYSCITAPPLSALFIRFGFWPRLNSTAQVSDILAPFTAANISLSHRAVLVSPCAVVLSQEPSAYRGTLVCNSYIKGCRFPQSRYSTLGQMHHSSDNTQ